MNQYSKIVIAIVALGFSLSAVAQKVEVDESGKTAPAGRARAAEYFVKRKPKAVEQDAERAPANEGGGGGPAAHYLALHLGTFIDDQAYRWGGGNQHDVGNLNIGVTYRIGEWINSADFMLRTEFTSYSLPEDTARKLNFLAMIMFPDTSSKFPLYFGAGVGPGFFIKQLRGQSVMSLDYQLVAGARFLDVIDNLGFFGEFGLKNHFHLFSKGQFNGLFVGAGTAWTF